MTDRRRWNYTTLPWIIIWYWQSFLYQCDGVYYGMGRHFNRTWSHALTNLSLWIWIDIRANNTNNSNRPIAYGPSTKMLFGKFIHWRLITHMLNKMRICSSTDNQFISQTNRSLWLICSLNSMEYRRSRLSFIMSNCYYFHGIEMRLSLFDNRTFSPIIFNIPSCIIHYIRCI